MTFPKDFSTKKLQEYIEFKVNERGFADEDIKDVCILLTEEVGELMKAIRKSSGIKTAVDAKTSSVEDELADVLKYLIGISNKLDIDLGKALRAKEKKDDERKWS